MSCIETNNLSSEVSIFVPSWRYYWRGERFKQYAQLLSIPYPKGNQGQAALSSICMKISPFSQKRSHLYCQLWFSFSFYLEIVIQAVNSTEQKHAAGVPFGRPEAPTNISSKIVSSYTIKTVLAKRLTWSRTGKFTTGWLLSRPVTERMCMAVRVGMYTPEDRAALSSPARHKQHGWYRSIACTVSNYKIHHISASSFPPSPLLQLFISFSVKFFWGWNFPKAITAQK